MIIKRPGAEDIPALRSLWQNTFGDTDWFLDQFFSKAFHPDRCLCAWEDSCLQGAVYWFDCSCAEEKLAYIYALAVEESQRGRGIGSCLMAHVHTLLARQGYSGVLLVPQEEDLRRLYERLGYLDGPHHRTLSAVAALDPVPLYPVEVEEYALLRKNYLPLNAVVQEGENLSFLQTQARFYRGANFLLAARQEGQTLYGLELLGDAGAAGGILRTLACEKGLFRTPGNDTRFAMFLPLKEEVRRPAYFAFAFDL